MEREYILVVNDDAAMMKALCRLFRRLDQPVAAARSHRTALQKIKRMPVKLVVVDADMPGLDGLGFFDRIRELSPDVAVIALGSWREKSGSYRLKNGSTIVSLTKPAKKEVLLEVARKAMAETAKR
jgi:CheY-like chemotaxis protein